MTAWTAAATRVDPSFGVRRSSHEPQPLSGGVTLQ